jgi:hypothetical protein
MARQAKFDAISGAVGSAASMFAGFGGGERPLFGMGGNDPFSRGQYSPIEDRYGEEGGVGNVVIDD